MPSKDIGNHLKIFLFSKSLLSRIVLVNIIIGLLLLSLSLFNILSPDKWNLKDWCFEHFGLHSNLQSLIEMPWTLVSYMFCHFNFWSLLFNMLMLYFGGILFSQYLGQRRFTYTYFFGGLAGALVFIISYNTFLSDKYTIVAGASAAVLSIFFGITAYIPNFEVNLFLFGRIKLKYLAIIFLGIDILSVSQSNAGEYLVHFGGALYGFLSVWAPRYFKNHSTNKRKLKVVKPRTSYGKEGRPLTDEEYNRIRAEKQKEIDAILDKISRSGYESLTQKEKDALFDSGNKN